MCATALGASHAEERVGGPDRDRTGDLLNAIQARSQLRYRPLLSSRTSHRNRRPECPQLRLYLRVARARDLRCPARAIRWTEAVKLASMPARADAQAAATRRADVRLRRV